MCSSLEFTEDEEAVLHVAPDNKYLTPSNRIHMKSIADLPLQPLDFTLWSCAVEPRLPD